MIPQYEVRTLKRERDETGVVFKSCIFKGPARHLALQLYPEGKTQLLNDFMQRTEVLQSMVWPSEG